MNDMTRILSEVEQGDPQAAELLLPLVYEELRRLAAAKLAQEKPGQTLEATALVHEAYLRLIGSQPEAQAREHWNSRGHFFAAAAEAMRRILVEQARHKQRHKHGGGRGRVDLDADQLAYCSTDEELLAIHDALDRLAAEDPQSAELVKLRYFAGLTADQAAQVLGISPTTAERYWSYARAWLHREITRGDEPA